MKKKMLLAFTALSLVFLTACTFPVNEPGQSTAHPQSEIQTTTAPLPSTTQSESKAITTEATQPSSSPAANENKTVSQQPASAKSDIITEQPQNTSESVTISKEKAIEIALAHANVNSADAKRIYAEIDSDRGIKHYDVEFDAANYEYDYEIDIGTGEILKSEKEIDD